VNKKPRRLPPKKKLAARAIRGQSGINLIERIVLEMGCSWVATGALDVGIDGYIELFGYDGNPLGKTLAVQSKVLSKFPNETNATFDYYCDERDLAYWLGGNMPVLLIISRPEHEEAYWVSLKDYFRTPDLVASKKVRFEKAQSLLTKDSLSHLLGTARAPNSGLYLGPIPRQERLISNLLRLDAFPQTLWLGATTFRRPQQLFPILNENPERIGSDWILHDGFVLSFQDLRNSPWNSICDQGTCDSFDTFEWASSKDLEKRRRFVELLNRALRDKMYPHSRWWPQQECFAFVAGPNGSSRKIRYQAISRPSSMTVVAKYTKRTTAGQLTTTFRHLGLRHQFRFLEGEWFLELTPTYVFTKDGVNIHRFHEDLLKGIKRIEGNRAVLSAVQCWASFLSDRDALFGEGSDLLRFRGLVEMVSPIGIDDKSWSGDKRREDTPGHEQDGDLFAEELVEEEP
jgi:hypothetical protein